MWYESDSELLRILPSLTIHNNIITDVEYSFSDLTGYSRDELLGKAVEELLDLLRINRRVYDITAIRDSMQIFLVTKSLQTRRVVLSVRRMEALGTYIFIFSEEPNSRLEDEIPFADRLCTDNIIAAAIYSCPELILLKANQPFMDILPAPLNSFEMVVGQRNEDFIPGWRSSPTVQIWQEVIATGKSRLIKEHGYRKKPDREIYYEYALTPVKAKGRLKYIAVIVNNVTNRIFSAPYVSDLPEQMEKGRQIILQQERLLNMEREKVESLKNIVKMKDDFFSFMSHEFKTPITVINSAIQAMETLCRDELTEKSKSYLRRIRQSSLRQLRLVNNLLDITRAEAGYLKVQKKNLDIVFITKELVESVMPYAKQKGTGIRFETSLSEKIIAIDEEKYERILLNLLSNAIKFTPQGKSIYVRLLQSGRKVFVEVQDEGIGIPEEKHAVIFDRYRQINNNLTRNSEGTGIGLALVKLLVELLGGKISLESEVGKGSRFSLELPVKELKEKNIGRQMQLDTSDQRLVQSIAVEFSDIYLT
jgi:signal transduction histidine kinase